MLRRSFLLTLPAAAAAEPAVPVHGLFEHTVNDGPRDPSATVKVEIRGPKSSHAIHAFWDVGTTWKFRFSPPHPGRYTFHIDMSPHSGAFRASGRGGSTELDRHGPPVLSPNRRYFTHADGKPWFFLSDTAWNGALFATEVEWEQYLKTRVAQRFTAIQFVTTQWRAGRRDVNGNVAFRVENGRLVLIPAFFQRLDQRVAAIRRHGLVPLPVMLWALTSRDKESPGVSLTTPLAAQLATYINARYAAYSTLWFLGGDGNYEGANAQRWRDIGRAVFPPNLDRRPVSLHPGGMRDPWPGLKDEPWLDFLTYQSGHGDSPAKWRWQAEQGLANGARLTPTRPVLDAEPDYEGHVAYNSKQVITDAVVRRAVYSSLFSAPPAGITYGAHGVWFWSRKAEVPLDHPGSGVALPWSQCLAYPGAQQMKVLRDLFDRIPWHTLRPDPKPAAAHKPDAQYSNPIQTLRSEDGKLALVYLPNNPSFQLDLSQFKGALKAEWLDPRTGAATPAGKHKPVSAAEFKTPGPGDWLLLLRA